MPDLILCPNCEATMNADESCPECDHDDRGACCCDHCIMSDEDHDTDEDYDE